ncbi:hypothetical protein AB0C29_30505 [Actinoplanes sp. NPDC048791]|uniref:hypothetical protein n=1 Tax=Actinoplanes sp. NPDC048791 TaxID=3154623 RepID=UPI0033DE3CE3
MRLVLILEIRERRRGHHAVRAQALGLVGRGQLDGDAPDGHEEPKAEQHGRPVVLVGR